MPPFEVQPLALYSCSLELGKVTSENSRLCLQADMSPVVILLIVQQPTASDTPWWSSQSDLLYPTAFYSHWTCLTFREANGPVPRPHPPAPVP